ncbi:MAG: methionyl-tRNA formyltransferase [Erysipelotrichaceae bacterium]|nr:methionyl-tRNA formyltransferase [Erysipelotrichaceae bacterium]
MKERIVFMGTSTFSLEVFKMLMEEGYRIVGVVTQPDKRVGRKKTLAMSEVKEEALKYDMPIIQPAKIRNDYQAILDLKPDMIITAAYGQIIPKALLDYPRLGCINVHASLLPKYRGGAPVHRCIINGDHMTGISIMYMTEKMDAGNIIKQERVPIYDDDNVGILYDRLSIIGASLLRKTLPFIIDKANDSIPQDESQVTYAYNLTREDEKINWNLTSRQVYNQVRGTNPWPGSYSTYNNKIVKIWNGNYQVNDSYQNIENGTIVDITKTTIGVKVSDGIYSITELQVEGKKKMLVRDYLNGHCMFELNTKFE